MPLKNIPSGRKIIARAKAGGGFEAVYDTLSLSTEWLSHSQTSRATAPLLRFTDLISGPSTGLGDGLGDGAIVTIWAQGIGDSQGTGKVYFTDSLGTKREAAHVYYWKRADGRLPSGPARLWYSHLMQEIAFSIPAGSVDGLGSITVETGGQISNALPFTVRPGSIFYVDNSGSDSADGSFDSPFRTYNGGARSAAPVGSTIYFRDLTIGTAENPVADAVYNNTGQQNTETNHYTVLGYPGTRAELYAKRCVNTYGDTTGMSVAKIAMYSLSHAEDENGQLTGSEFDGTLRGTVCLETCRWGRGIGNLCTDVAGFCSDGQGGAISGGHSKGEAYKIYGNEVYDYSCPGASKLHHTTYMTIRDKDRSDPAYESWEWDFNFLHGNQAKFGIHNYDETDGSGRLTTPLNIKNNVVVQQAGAGISVGQTGAPGWDMDINIENNLLIDVGGPADWNGVDPLTSNQNEAGGINFRDGKLFSAVRCFDNLVYKYSEYLEADNPVNAFGAMGYISSNFNMSMEWSRNVAYSEKDFPFIGPDIPMTLNGSDNCWHYTGQSPSYASVPAFDTAPITADPQITFDGCIAIVAPTSPLKGRGAATGYDLYGVPRSTYQTAGPVEALS